jgi:DNA-binding NtrC family response regulator
MGLSFGTKGRSTSRVSLGAGPTSSFRCHWKGRSGKSNRWSLRTQSPHLRENCASSCVYLNEEQHEFVTAINGRDGLEKFRQGDFDIVLTDRAMPEMNGDALAAEIKRIKPSQPIILLTGFGDLMASSGEKPTGVDLVVGKPFTLGTLRNAIAKVVERPAAVSH